MIYHWFAGVVVLIHTVFVVFVVVGGLLALRWRWLLWLHVPTAIWGVLIEYAGWICPLTPLENMLRERAGLAGYAGGFVDHYVLRQLYPSGLTSHERWMLGSLALTVNVAVYTIIVWQHYRRNLASRRGG